MSISYSYSENDTIVVRCGDEVFEIPLPSRRPAAHPSGSGDPAQPPAPPPSAGGAEPPPWEIPVIGLVGRTSIDQSVARYDWYRNPGMAKAPWVPAEALLAGGRGTYDRAIRDALASSGTRPNILNVMVGPKSIGQSFALRDLRAIVDSEDNPIDLVRLVGPAAP